MVNEPMNQLVCRGGEIERVWVRMDRFYQVGEEWYFSTRESEDMGPFASLADAEEALIRYVAQL